MKLGTLLLRNAAIGLSQLEAALRNQVLYGGRLGTNLVELGFIDLELLSTYLAELSGFPIATPTLLDDADKGLLTRLGGEEAHRLRAMPLGYLGSGTQTIAVAMVDPTDGNALEALGKQLGASITPYVVPELRVLYYLERHYGLPRRARFIRTARAGSEADPADERRRSQPAGGIAMPPAFTLEPRRRRNSSQAPFSDSIPTALSYGAACEKIDTATHREHIAEAFINYAKGRCDALVVLLIRDGNAIGWRGYVAPPRVPKLPFEELSLPLGGASALQSAHDSGHVFVGPPPSPAKPIETTLWQALGAEPHPTEVVAVPILVKQRPVNLVYAHTLGGSPPTSFVNELQDLASRAQTSYLRLIRQTRGS
ncbi:MAG: ral secretory system protein domain protein [Myxococcales bacterium]|nr:ral secretory system protein domain protein [Myxococcales bacterium]